MSDRTRLVRWRLVLGAGAQGALGCDLDAAAQAQDHALGYLYDREYGANRNVRQNDQRGGLGGSAVQPWFTSPFDSVLTSSRLRRRPTAQRDARIHAKFVWLRFKKAAD